MDKKVAKNLSRLKSLSVMELLKRDGGIGVLNDYSHNAHPYGEADWDKICEIARMSDEDRCKLIGKKFVPKADYVAAMNDAKEMPNMYFQGMGGNFGIQHVKKRYFPHQFIYILCGMKDGGDVYKDHLRLYLNLKPKNVAEFAKLFYEEIRKHNKTRQFKISTSNWEDGTYRTDNWVLYTTYDDLNFDIKLITKIKGEHPELFEGAEKLNPNWGAINGFIGYAESPYKVENSELKPRGGESYTTIRNKLIKDIYLEIQHQAVKENGYKTDNLFSLQVDDAQNLMRCKDEFQFTGMTLDDYLKNKYFRQLKNSQLSENEKNVGYMEFKRQFKNNVLWGEIFDGWNDLLNEEKVFNKQFGNIWNKAAPIEIQTMEREYLATHICRESIVDSEKDKRMYQSVAKEFDRALQESLKNGDNEINEILNKKFPSQEGRLALKRLLTLQLFNRPHTRQTTGRNLSSGAAVVNLSYTDALRHERINFDVKHNGKIVDITKYMNLANIYIDYIGEKRANEIILEKCREYNVDPNNVAFNWTTKTLINRALATNTSNM